LPDSSIFNQDISKLAPASNSDAVISFLSAQNNNLFAPGGLQFDESMYLLNTSSAGSTTTMVKVNIEYSSPCNGVSKFPIVTPGGIEGTNPPSFAQGSCQGDCHIAVVDPENKAFYDSFVSYVTDNVLHADCAIKWCSTYNYPNGLGNQCTSCDAAGFPIAALLLTADELELGVLDHAVRFILPGLWMGTGYVSPATHGTTDSHSTDPNAPLYGYRFRLKSSFDTSGYSHQEKVVIKGLQTYGMFLADEGNIPITISNDAFTKSKYPNSFDTHAIYNILPSDFEVMPYDGKPQPITYNCKPLKLPRDCKTAKLSSPKLTPRDMEEAQTREAPQPQPAHQPKVDVRSDQEPASAGSGASLYDFFAGLW